MQFPLPLVGPETCKISEFILIHMYSVLPRGNNNMNQSWWLFILANLLVQHSVGLCCWRWRQSKSTSWENETVDFDWRCRLIALIQTCGNMCSYLSVLLLVTVCLSVLVFSTTNVGICLCPIAWRMLDSCFNAWNMPGWESFERVEQEC